MVKIKAEENNKLSLRLSNGSKLKQLQQVQMQVDQKQYHYY
jgi:hypothetical protein